MKKTGLKRLHMEAEEIAKNITWLREEIAFREADNKYQPPKIMAQFYSNLKAQERKYKGILEKAENYGKGEVIYRVVIRLNDMYSYEKSIHYTGIEPEEVDLLVNRDFKGLKYKVLRKEQIISGKITPI